MSIIDFENHFINLIKDVFTKTYNFTDELDQLHDLLQTNQIPEEELIYQSQTKILGKNDRKSIFIKKFHQYIDSENREPVNNKTFTEIYHEFIKKYISSMFPNEKSLVIQKTPNIRFSFPNNVAIGSNALNENGTPIDPQGIIGLHKDADFGHHFTEQNFIIPITDMFDTNSFYYNPNIYREVDDYINVSLKKNKFFTGYLNQWSHYNRENQTGKTRISFDLRIMPYSSYKKYENYFIGTKFELDKGYYSLLQL